MNTIQTYYKVDEQSGKLISTIHVTPEEATQQGLCTEEAPSFDLYEEGFWPHLIDGVWIKRPIAQDALSYGELRRAAYPSVTQQLDALWHAMNLGEIPKATAFFDALAQVKAQYPKPEEEGSHVAYQMPEE